MPQNLLTYFIVTINMFSLINKPTRVTDTSATLIDHIWSNDYNNCIKNGIVFDDSLSDHFPIFAVFNHLEQVNNDNRKKETILTYRDFSVNNINNFKTQLNLVDWGLITGSNNVNVACDNFNLIFSNLFERHFPILTKKVKNSDNKPYGHET